MNIAILHYSVPPIVGGVESVIAHHARLMSADGHMVRLIAGRGESLNHQIPLIHLPLVDSQHPRVRVAKAQLDRGEVTGEFEALRDELITELQTALRGVDVLIAHNVCSLHKNLALTAALHQLHKTRVRPRLILWHHDLAWTAPRYQTELHAGYPWNLLRFAWNETTQVVVSELRRAELADLMNLPRESIQVIPNGMDITRFYKLEPLTQILLERTNLLEASPILLLPVRVTPRKNIEMALHVLAELQRQFPQAALVVTGPLGPHNASNHQYFEALKSLRARLGLDRAAHFLTELQEGYLPDEVISDFFRVADALFLPSREEGFGIPLLEAGLSHLPVFCADIPPLHAIGANHASYFSPDEDPAKLAQLLGTYFQSSLPTHLALHVRSSYRWESIYRQQISPLLKRQDL